MMKKKILVPDIGDFENIAVIEVLANVGDSIAAEESLLTLESDKATMDVPSPFTGKITAVHIKAGDKVSAGTHIADMEVHESANDTKSQNESENESQNESENESKNDAKNESAESSPPAEVPVSRTEKSPASAASAAAAKEVRVPDIGDFENVAVIEVLANVGDSIAAEESLLTLESDKATMDVPSPFTGKITAVHIKAGDKVSAGTHIADMEVRESANDTKSQNESQNDAENAPAKETQTPNPPAPSAQKPARQSGGDSHSSAPIATNTGGTKPHASPSVRRFARELGADLHKIKGGGPRGRILKEDVQNFIKTKMQQGDSGDGLPTVPPVDFAKFGEVETLPLPRIRKLSAANLRRNWLVAPHVTQCGEADITDMENFRKSLAEDAKGFKMTPLAFFIRAAVMALREFPDFNASLHSDGENLVRKKYFHIGVAVDTPHGLVVPVLRDADKKGLTDIARELAEISARARDGKLKAEEMQGGCFTISSLGGIGGSFFTPIINLPEAAILGVSRSAILPRWDGEKFAPRLILPLSLSYDHRIIDGASGARFMVYYSSLLGDIRRLSL